MGIKSCHFLINFWPQDLKTGLKPLSDLWKFRALLRPVLRERGPKVVTVLSRIWPLDLSDHPGISECAIRSSVNLLSVHRQSVIRHPSSVVDQLPAIPALSPMARSRTRERGCRCTGWVYRAGVHGGCTVGDVHCPGTPHRCTPPRYRHDEHRQHGVATLKHVEVRSRD